MDLDPKENTEAATMWRNLESHLDSPEFRERLSREFPDDFDKWADPVTRREFVKLMGASLALAGLATGCSPRPVSPQVIVPYVRQPEQLTLGVPLFYATASTLNGIATGLIVKSREGRPIKVEGNPDHPGCRAPASKDEEFPHAGTDIFSQASILDMYDPDRSKVVRNEGQPSTWGAAFAAFGAELKKHKNSGKVRILTETVTSPSLAEVIKQFQAEYEGTKWIQYDPAGRDNVRLGSKAAFSGEVIDTIYDFSKAKRVLSLDCDFLGLGIPGGVRYAHDFMSARHKVIHGSAHRHGDHYHASVDKSELSRLYVVETMMTPTGSSADHRLPLKPSDIEVFARKLAAELGVANAPEAGDFTLWTTSEGASEEETEARKRMDSLTEEWIEHLAADLKEWGNESLVIPGDHMPPSVHAICHAINETLGNIGETVKHIQPVQAQTSETGSGVADLEALTEEMRAGEVDVLFIFGSNPVYTAPADLGFLDALERVPLRAHHGLMEDETAVHCHWHLPATHFLEAWGDARAYDGTVTVQQPLIEPLYEGRSVLSVFGELLQLTVSDARSIVRDHWRKIWKAGDFTTLFETWWEEAIQRGVIPNTACAVKEVKVAADWGEQTASGEYEIAFLPDPCVYDGRFANNGWLQEMPKPLTAVTWGNVAYMSPRTMMQKLGLSKPNPSWTAGERGRVYSDTVKITMPGPKPEGAAASPSVVATAFPVPGMADGAIVLTLGYGRTHAGGTAPQAIGANAYAIRTTKTLWSAPVEAPEATGDEEIVACVQFHHSMEGRAPARSNTVDNYEKDPTFAWIGAAAAGEIDLYRQNLPGVKYAPKDEEEEKSDHDHAHDPRMTPLTMYPENVLPLPEGTKVNRWAMAFDLTSCTGCGVCVVACQAENNIPVVGREEVTKGREMHWIRVDSYFQGESLDADRLRALVQPVNCQQCEKAPCELVCPVAATVHSADGLNDMVYNRCVGTRYCSNNCPYKVRRFNFISYADYTTESLKLGRNPEVTVRSRGVMEKCTYCVQRIRAAEIVAQREGRDIADGEVKPACQSACPSEAIVFGDLSDEKSEVMEWKQEPLNYGLLAELNTMPRTTYLASLRNPNPDMPNKQQEPDTKGEE